MGYRNIVISSPAELRVKHSQLVVKTLEEHSFPLEDINAIMLENPKATLNAYLLNELGERGICTFVCNQKHMPTSLILPFKTHYHKVKMLQLQLGVKKPLEKKIWQQIVMQKIQNQGEVLRLLDLAQWEEVVSIASKVKTGDGDNMEAVAAAKYFKLLFGKAFTRSDESGVNAALNYGYAIVRGHICRTLVMHGLEPELGVFHANNYNTFNLADDFIEVYRPVIDLFVATHMELFEDELTSEGKHGLFQVVNMNVKSGGELHPVHYAIERTVQSYVRTLKSGELDLRLCSILPLVPHTYE